MQLLGINAISIVVTNVSVVLVKVLISVRGAGCAGTYGSCHGAGWSSNGDGLSFLSSETGGTSNYNGDGGFGGGGAQHHPGGGGGGYHGGDCGHNFPNTDGCNRMDNGRGGFSYNAGSNGYWRK